MTFNKKKKTKEYQKANFLIRRHVIKKDHKGRL